MKELTTFGDKRFGEIRAISIDGEPWFVGKDVAVALGYEKYRNAIAVHVDDDDKKGAPIQGPLGGEQKMTIINESGLYSLIFSSKLPGAKDFKRWVTSEVLPSIRRTGQYIYGERRLPTVEHPAPFERQDKAKVRKNWFNYMLAALERELGITKDNMLHQSYESMKNEGIDVEMIKERYIEDTGRTDCSTFEAICSDRGATLELSGILCRNMEITFIKRCM